MSARLDRAEVFLSVEPQIIIAWGSAAGEPDIEGDLSLVTEAPVPRRVLGFGSWLSPEAAQEFESYVDRLRRRGEVWCIQPALLRRPPAAHEHRIT